MLSISNAFCPRGCLKRLKHGLASCYLVLRSLIVEVVNFLVSTGAYVFRSVLFSRGPLIPYLLVHMLEETHVVCIVHI